MLSLIARMMALVLHPDLQLLLGQLLVLQFGWSIANHVAAQAKRFLSCPGASGPAIVTRAGGLILNRSRVGPHGAYLTGTRERSVDFVACRR